VGDFTHFITTHFGVWETLFLTVGSAFLAYVKYIARGMTPPRTVPSSLIVGYALTCLLVVTYWAWRNEHVELARLRAPQLAIELLYASIVVDDETNSLSTLLTVKLENTGNLPSNCRRFGANVDVENARDYAVTEAVFKENGVEIYTRDGRDRLRYGIADDLLHKTRAGRAIGPGEIVAGYLLFELRRTQSLEAAIRMAGAVNPAVIRVTCVDMQNNEITAEAAIRGKPDDSIVRFPGLSPLADDETNRR
jgi:hypothetical protein